MEHAHVSSAQRKAPIRIDALLDWSFFKGMQLRDTSPTRTDADDKVDYFKLGSIMTQLAGYGVIDKWIGYARMIDEPNLGLCFAAPNPYNYGSMDDHVGFVNVKVIKESLYMGKDMFSKWIDLPVTYWEGGRRYDVVFHAYGRHCKKIRFTHLACSDTGPKVVRKTDELFGEDAARLAIMRMFVLGRKPTLEMAMAMSAELEKRKSEGNLPKNSVWGRKR